jgi:hypothetical protein
MGNALGLGFAHKGPDSPDFLCSGGTFCAAATTQAAVDGHHGFK